MSRFDSKIRRTLLISFFALAMIGALLAQTSTGVIVGQVKDITGAVLAGATVEIVNSGTRLTQNVKTNNDGFYRSPDLPPGVYDITMAHSGFKSADVKGVPWQINQTARVDITAELGAVTEHVEVQSSAPLLQTETSSTRTGDPKPDHRQPPPQWAKLSGPDKARPRRGPGAGWQGKRDQSKSGLRLGPRHQWRTNGERGLCPRRHLG